VPYLFCCETNWSCKIYKRNERRKRERERERELESFCESLLRVLLKVFVFVFLDFFGMFFFGYIFMRIEYFSRIVHLKSLCHARPMADLYLCYVLSCCIKLELFFSVRNIWEYKNSAFLWMCEFVIFCSEFICRSRTRWFVEGFFFKVFANKKINVVRLLF